jgi:rhodanese-related sulfurtransferase
MRRYVWIFMLAFMVTCFVGCEEKNTSVSTESQNSYIQIQMDEAITMMEEETDYIILDVRTPEEFAEKHIPGAVNVPNESIGTEEIKELPNKDQLILVYCRSGNRSKQASEKLVALGYTNVYEFGGINDWPGEVESE